MYALDPAGERRALIPGRTGRLVASRYNVTVTGDRAVGHGPLVDNTWSGAAAEPTSPEAAALAQLAAPDGMPLRVLLSATAEVAPLYEHGFVVDTRHDEFVDVVAERDY
jgi:hypothetical protein